MPADKKHRTKDFLVRYGTLAVLIAASVFFFPQEKSIEYAYEVGQITTEEVIAPFEFPILKTREVLEQDRAEALEKVLPLFEKKDDITTIQLEAMDSFFDDLREVKLARSRYGAGLATLAVRGTRADSAFLAQVREDSLVLFTLMDRIQGEHDFDVTNPRWNFLLEAGSSREISVRVLETFQANLARILDDIFRDGIIDVSLNDISKKQIAVLERGEEVTGDKGFYWDLSSSWGEGLAKLKASLGKDEGDEITVGYDILAEFLRPNITYDEETTLAREEDTIALVPISSGWVYKDERVFLENVKVTEELKQKLESMFAEKAKRGTASGGISTLLPQIGRGLLVTVILFFFGAFIVAYRPQIYRDNRMVLLIGLIFLSQLVLASLVIHRGGYSEYLLPIAIASMVLTILVDARIAFIGTATLSLLIGVILGNKLDFVVVSTFAGTMSVFSVTQLRTRAQLFKSVLYIFGAYIIAITAVELLKFSGPEVFLVSFGFAAANAILSPIIVLGIIGVLEIGFGITTDLSLLELSDLNRPLLKKLAVRAPGTYHHSVIVGNLAEEAAAAIGANSLLARVGAYYHDIGKMNKPEYFSENQMGAENRHEILRPNLSALILTSHVREGIVLAKKYKLPSVIIDFIASHHGTGRMEFFYAKALREVEDPSTLDDVDFRYPGPRPKTKETGILMLCESIEAATRSIRDKTMNRITDTVNSLIESRIKTGQLNECDLTLAEIDKIRKAILPILLGVYHLRVEYPSDEKPAETKSAKSFGNGQNRQRHSITPKSEPNAKKN